MTSQTKEELELKKQKQLTHLTKSQLIDMETHRFNESTYLKDRRTWPAFFQYLLVQLLVYGGWSVYLGFMLLGIYLQSYFLIGFLILLYIYQLSSYCTLQNWFVQFINTPLLYKYFKNWSVHMEEEVYPTKSMLIMHPHGMLNLGFIMGHPFYNTVNCAASRVIMSVPGTGMIIKWLGGVSVDISNLQKFFDKGDNVGILPGGFEEATLTTKTECRIYLKNRKGFIKYALKYGYRIYPGYVFGENKLYSLFTPLLKFRLFLNKYKLPGVLFMSKYLFYPERNTSMHIVVGSPLKLPQISNPTKEEINKYHQIYQETIKALFYKYRERYGETSELVIY